MLPFFFLCWLANSGTNLAHASGVDRLRVFLETTHTLRAEFTQRVTTGQGRHPQLSSGLMLLSRPGKFRWQIDHPDAQLMLGDGEKIWLYDTELKQVTVRKMNAALESTPAALLMGEANLASLEKKFLLQDIGEQDGLEWVEAKSRVPESGFERLRLGFLNTELRTMILFDHFGQTSTVRFDKIERNRALSPALFRFTVPVGVDVLSE